MRLHRLLLFASLMLASAAAVFQRAGSWLWHTFAPLPSPDPLPRIGDRMDFGRVASPLDPALRNSLRHEAGMRPLPG